MKREAICKYGKINYSGKFTTQIKEVRERQKVMKMDWEKFESEI